MSHSRARGWFRRADSRRGIWLLMVWKRTSMLFCSRLKVELRRAAQSSFNLRQTRRTVEFSLKVMYSRILMSSSAGSSTRASWRFAPPRPPGHRVSPSHSPFLEQCVRVCGRILIGDEETGTYDPISSSPPSPPRLPTTSHSTILLPVDPAPPITPPTYILALL